MRTPKSARTGDSATKAPSGPATTTVVKVGVALFIALNFTARGVLSLVVAIGSPLLLLAIHDTDMDPVQVKAPPYHAILSLALTRERAAALRRVHHSRTLARCSWPWGRSDSLCTSAARS